MKDIANLILLAWMYMHTRVLVGLFVLYLQTNCSDQIVPIHTGVAIYQHAGCSTYITGVEYLPHAGTKFRQRMQLIRPFCITILSNNLLLFMDIFHIRMQYLCYFILFCMFDDC